MRAPTILLVTAMALPGCAETAEILRDVLEPARTDPREPAPAEPKNEPLIAWTWFPTRASEQDRSFDNIFHPPVVRSWMSADHIIKDLKLAELPPGRRVIRPFVTEQDHKLHNHPSDVPPWADHGVRAVRAWWEPLLADLKRKGVVLDGVLLDDEIYIGYWNKEVRDRFDEIMAHPRREELFQRLGFRDLNLMHRHASSAVARDAVVTFNSVMHDYFQQAIHEAYVEPLKRHNPNAWFSNYANERLMRSHYVAPDQNGWPLVHECDPVGDRVQTAAYPTRSGRMFHNGSVNPTGARRAWGATFINAVLLEANQAVAVARNPDNRPLQVWLPTVEFEGLFDQYAAEMPGVTADELWRSWCTWMIYRYVPEEIIWFNYHRDERQSGQERELSKMLEKFTRMGIVGARPLDTEPHPWDATRLTAGFVNRRGETFTCTIDAGGRIIESRGR